MLHSGRLRSLHENNESHNLKVDASKISLIYTTQHYVFSRIDQIYSLPQKARSFWWVPRIGTSENVQFSGHAQAACARNLFRILSLSDCQSWLWAYAEWREVRESRTFGFLPRDRDSLCWPKGRFLSIFFFNCYHWLSRLSSLERGRNLVVNDKDNRESTSRNYRSDSCPLEIWCSWN